MVYQTEIFESSQHIPLGDWLQVNGGDPLMDIRLLECLEVGWGSGCRFWPVLIRDRDQMAVAAAILCLHSVDAAQMGQPAIRRLCKTIRRVWPSFLKFRVLVCGIPISGAQSSLRIEPSCDTVEVMRALQSLMREVAWKHRARMLIVKEMSDVEAKATDALQSFGFLKGASLPTNSVTCRSPTLEEWMATLRSHYRYKLRRSLVKFDRSGLTCEHLRGDAITRVYTRDVHQLYLDVVASHDVNFEVLPYAFFLELPRRLPEHVCMTVMREGEQIVGFSWSILSDDRYQNLLVGFDYDRNGAYDLYFNLMIRDLKFGYEHGVRHVLLGQTSDTFKSRLGATQQRRWFYVRTVKPAMWVFRALSKWLFPAIPLQPPIRDLYKKATEMDSCARPGRRPRR